MCSWHNCPNNTRATERASSQALWMWLLLLHLLGGTAASEAAFCWLGCPGAQPWGLQVTGAAVQRG